MSDLIEPAPVMRPRDWFAVGLRLFGVWACIRGFDYGISLAALRLGLGTSQASPFDRHAEVLSYLFFASADIALGVCLIMAAEQIADFAFRVRVRGSEHRDDSDRQELMSTPGAP
jgi:hypothetical protein